MSSVTDHEEIWHAESDCLVGGSKGREVYSSNASDRKSSHVPGDNTAKTDDGMETSYQIGRQENFHRYQTSQALIAGWGVYSLPRTNQSVRK